MPPSKAEQRSELSAVVIQKAETERIHSEHDGDLLNPSLKFYAASFRAYHHARNRVFARTIIDPIAENTKGCPMSLVGYRGYGFGPSWLTELDERLGYPAIEVFERHHDDVVVAMAKEDLKKRGFIVRDLQLYLGNINNPIRLGEEESETNGLAECSYGSHGIFVKWNLGIWYIT